MRRNYVASANRVGLCAIVGLALVLAGCSKSSSGGSSSDTSPSGDNAKGNDPQFGDDPVSKVRMAAARASSQNNLKQIGVAMHNYLSTYNDFPATAICDAKGKPLLSWRVTILPYIEHADLYNQFKLDEAWDSEHNKKLISKMPKTYLLPGTGKETGGMSHYRALASVPSEVGNEGAAFNWVDPKQPGPIKGNGINYFLAGDGTSNTILVVEAAEPVEWTKPDELIYAPKKPLPKLGYHWRGNCQVVFADGSVHSINDKVSETTLRALVTARAGDTPGNDY